MIHWQELDRRTAESSTPAWEPRFDEWSQRGYLRLAHQGKPQNH